VARVFQRRFAWLVVPSLVGVVVASVVALALPPVYTASTTILIEPPGIPDRLIETTVVQDKEARFHNIRLRILSRDNLSAVIDDLELFPGSEGTPREELVARMRQQTAIQPILPEVTDPRKGLEINSLRIAYSADDPTVAAEVANRLARDFIRRNLSERAADAEGTSEFIEAELKREEARISQIARAIQDYKEEHLGSLPEQLETSRRSLERLYVELNEKKTELEFARNQANMVRKQLGELAKQGGAPDSSPSERKADLEQRLSVMRANGFTDRHPDIRVAKSELAALKAQLEAAAQEEPEEETELAPATPYEARLLEDLRNFEVNLTVRGQEVERLREEIDKYEARIENTPRVAAGLTVLLDRHTMISDAIEQLQFKANRAGIARSMETKQKGEKFRVIESAQAPEAPESPNRPLIFAIGAILGIFSGVALVVVREVTDRRLYTLEDLSAAIQLPVLASVSRIRLPAEIAEARARVRRIGVASAVGVMLLVGSAAVFYLVRSGDSPALPTVPAAPAAEESGGGDV
jgi:polysaccharide chain length determinant protein (PEP-CTERM system associated)